MTEIITAPFKYNCEDKVGTYMDESEYDTLVDFDCDFYAPIEDVTGAENSEANIIFKYRKNVFTEAEQLGAYEGLVGAALPTQNRGLAAGPRGDKCGGRDYVTLDQSEILDYYIDPDKGSLFEENDPVGAIIEKYRTAPKEDTRGIVWLRSKITDAGYNYETFFDDKMQELKQMPKDVAAAHAANIKKNYISDTTYANQVLSGIAGFFDRYPRIPYGRATSYTEDNYELYTKCFPFMTKLADKFAELLPFRYTAQQDCAEKLDPKFLVGEGRTPFTTITVNKNFRTAAHRDAGDLTEGFSNLTVVAKDKEWEGGYLVLPEYRVAVNIRPGDLLLINNHEGIHGNTEMKPPAGKTIEEMERISLVCYFREKMLELGDKKYEDCRRSFVDNRRLNKEHPLWKERWNGVSPDMWKGQEWYDYLTETLGESYTRKYHPESFEKGSLEEFFG